MKGESSHKGLRLTGTSVVEPLAVEVQVSFLCAKIFRHGDAEHAPLAARQEVGRLAAVRAAGLDSVIRPYGNVEILFQVPIVVAEENTEGAVRVFIPAFERSGHVLAGVVFRLQG